VVRSVYSDGLLLDGLWSVWFIATGVGWTCCERSEFSDLRRVDGMGSVVVVASGYRWTCCGA